MNLNLKLLATKSLVMIDKSASLKEAARKMREFNVSSVVIKEGDSIVGILTERDITTAVANGESYEKPAINFATTKLIKIEADKTVYDALNTMLSHGIRHLIVTEKGKDIGVVSMRDLMSALSLMYAEESSY